MPPTFLDSMWTVARKEMLLHFKTKRLLVIGGVFAAVIIIISLYGGYLTGQAQDEPTYEQGAASVMFAVFQFSSLLPAVLAIALTYDAIVGEKNNHSMYLLASKPVRREAIYMGKLLGAWLAIALVYFVVFSLGFVLVIGMAGTAPTADGVADVYGAIGIILLGTGAWMSFVLLMSALFKTTASTLITSVMSWLLIFSLISQAGLIYYAVTISGEEVEPNVSLDYSPMGGNQTVLTFSSASMLDYSDLWVSVESQGNPVVTELPSTGNASHSYVVSAGEYSWTAYFAEDKQPSSAFANGTVTVVDGAQMHFGLTALDDDYYFNDVEFWLVDSESNPYPGGSYSVAGEGSPAFVPMDQAFFQEKNLTEGPFVASVILGNETFMRTTFHSYGEQLSGDLALYAALMGTDDEAPGYVRGMYAVNPDNCIGAYAYLFVPEHVGILSLAESVGSLCAFTATCLLIGLFVFRKKGLA